MTGALEFGEFSPALIADDLPRRQIMDATIRPLWPQAPRIAGPAYTVRCGPGDHLMLHAAIYRAPAGAVVVVEAEPPDFALAGGNVCAVARKNGIAGFVLDGAIRDVADIRAAGFPVFCRAVVAKGGSKDHLGALQVAVTCGGVLVMPGDVVVADEEGVVVIPKADQASAHAAARKRATAESAQTLAGWEQDHRRRIEEILAKKGFAG